MFTVADNTDREVFDRLGGLGEAVKNLNEGMLAMRASMERNERRADERAKEASQARRDLHRKVDTVRDTVNSLERKVETDLGEIRDRLEGVEVLAADAKSGADDYRRVVQQGRGALFVVGIGGASFGGAFIWFFDGVLAWLKTRMGL